MKKLLSAPAFQFKGSGWYVTDYARKGGAGAASAKGDSSGGDASPAASSDGESSKGSNSTKSEAPAPAAKPSSGSDSKE